jgi:hypothetical protein
VYSISAKINQYYPCLSLPSVKGRSMTANAILAVPLDTGQTFSVGCFSCDS